MGAAAGLSSGAFGERGAISLVGDLQVSFGFCTGAVFRIKMLCVWLKLFQELSEILWALSQG